MRQWYYSQSGQQLGPVEQNDLIQMIKEGRLSHQDYIWTEGMPEWGAIEKSPFAKFATAPHSGTRPVNTDIQDINETGSPTMEEPAQQTFEPEPAYTPQLQSQPQSQPQPQAQDFSSNMPVSPLSQGVVESKPETLKSGGRLMDSAADKKTEVKEPKISGKSYQHSGNFEPIGMAYVLGIAGGGILLMSPIYSAGIKYIPMIYLNILLTLGYGFASGFLVNLGGKMGKVRNNQLLTVTGLLMGVYALYCAWASYFTIVLGEMVVSPITIMKYMEIVSEKGSWSIKGSMVNGAALYAVWAIEALIIIITGAFSAKIEEPFCEDCNDWIETKDEIGPLEPTLHGDLIAKALQRSDFTILKAIKPSMDSESDHTKLTMLRCLACNKKFFLTVTSVAFVINSKGKSERSETHIVKNLIINQEIFKSLMANWKGAGGF